MVRFIMIQVYIEFYTLSIQFAICKGHIQGPTESVSQQNVTVCHSRFSLLSEIILFPLFAPQDMGNAFFGRLYKFTVFVFPHLKTRLIKTYMNKVLIGEASTYLNLIPIEASSNTFSLTGKLL